MTKETPQTAIERLEGENSELREENVRLRMQIDAMKQQEQAMAALFRGAQPTREGRTAHAESNSRCVVTPEIITKEIRSNTKVLTFPKEVVKQRLLFAKLKTLLNGTPYFGKETSFGHVHVQLMSGYISVEVQSPEPRNVWHTFNLSQTGILFAEKEDRDGPFKNDLEFTLQQLLSEL